MATPTSRVIRNVLVLGAVGDALGKPVEFSRASSIEREYGTEPPDRLAYAEAPPAQITDDTQMTLFMVEGLCRARRQGNADQRAALRDEIARSLVHWLATQDPKVLDEVGDGDSRLLAVDELHDQRAPGNTCLSSCRHIFRGGQLPDMDNRINDSKGCGAVMRSAPFGVAASSVDQAFGWARDTGVLTHCHPSGYLSAAYFAAVVYQLVDGRGLGEAMERADELLDGEPAAEETQRAVEAARDVGADGQPVSLEQIEQLGEGWVGEEALAIALACAGSADTSSVRGIRQALWLSVRHSGDSDSTGTLTGNLLGALADPEALPEDWIEELELLDVVEDCAAGLAGPSSG